MAATTGDTMAEGLKKVLAQFGQLMSLPDSDLDFLSGVQTQIAQYLREGALSAQGGNLQLPPGPGAPGPANASPLGDMGGAPMGMGAPGGMGVGAGGGMMAPPGGNMGIQPPPMDEISRMLAGGQP